MIQLNSAIHGLAAFVESRPFGGQTHEDLYELAVGTFAYNRASGVPSGLLSSYSALNDCGQLPEEARDRGISEEMTSGQRLDMQSLCRIIGPADLIVARDPWRIRAVLDGLKGLNLDHKLWVAVPFPKDDVPLRALDTVVACLTWLQGRAKDGEPRLAELLRRME